MHLATVAVVAAAVLVARSSAVTLFRAVGAVVLLAVAAVVAPLPRRRSLPATGLRAADGPALFGLLRDAATAVGGRPPAAVAVSPAVELEPVDGRGPALLGLLTWHLLGDGGRRAALTRLVAATAAGDVRREPLVAAAGRTLQSWRYLLGPAMPTPRRAPRLRRSAAGRGGTVVAPSDRLRAALLSPAYGIVVLLDRALQLASTRPAVRADARARDLTAAVAGADAAAELAALLAGRDRLLDALTVALRRDPRADLLAAAQDWSGHPAVPPGPALAAADAELRRHQEAVLLDLRDQLG